MARVSVALELPGVLPSEAAALWWDPARWASFVAGFAAVHKREGAWPEAGGRLVWDARPDSDRGRVVEVVEHRDADGGADVRIEDARLTGEQRVRFAATGRGTLVTLELRYAPKAPAAPLADLVYVRRRLRRGLERTLARFAREAEMERELTRTPGSGGA